MPKQLYLRNYPKISKNEASNLLDQSLFCPFYRLQGWLMTMRMIVNGKEIK